MNGVLNLRRLATSLEVWCRRSLQVWCPSYPSRALCKQLDAPWVKWDGSCHLHHHRLGDEHPAILYTPTIMVWKTRATVLIDPHLFWVDHRICLAWIPNTRCWRCNLDSPHARPPFLSVLVHSGPRLHCYIDRSEPCKGRSSEKMLGWAVGHRKTSGFCKVYENIRKSNTWPSEEEYMKIISSPLVPP